MPDPATATTTATATATTTATDTVRPRRLRPTAAAAALAATLAVTLAAALLGGAVLCGSTAAAGPAPHEPAPDTIVAVEGDAANGFGIYRYDGTAVFPPTDSEALAECGEYDTLRARVRCRTQVRTWYRDLADIQQTIAYYRSLHPGPER